MADQGNDQDKLANNLQNTSLGGQGGPDRRLNAQNAFNAGASSFVPQTYQQYQPQGYQGYQPQGYQPQGYQPQGYQGYQGYQPQAGQGYYNQGYNQYDQYASYSAQQPAQPQGMSLADYQKQNQASQASLNKPKRTLKLASSSGIKLANAKPAAPEKEEPAEKKEQTKVETKVEPKVEAKIEPKKEVKKAESPAPVKSKESTPVPEVKTKVKESKVAREAAATAASSSAALKKQQELQIDAEVVKDMFGGKEHISIIFMGHVDAGKSTMGGNILYLTGSVDKRTVEKYEREAKDAGRQGWYLSWVMDTNKEERNDGKTIEVGKAYFETDKRRYTILDAPGHKMYVSEMIGGASQADVGILVISARKGEYETGFEKGGQTREHALLAKTQGVNKIVVVVNKMDDATVGWAEDRYKDCITKLGAFLKGIGYSKDDIVFMPVSGYTGAGLKERVSPTDCPWYTGPSLLEYLDNMPTTERHINAPFMLPISGKMKDLGTVVEGKIESGHIKKNESLLLMPNKVSVEVVTIYNETEQECDAAFCGEQVRLRIKGVEEEDLAPGYLLTSPNNPVKTVTRFEAQIAIVELRSILSNGFSCVMHLHTAIEEVKFVELKHKLEKGTNRKSKKPPAFAKKGMKIIAVLEANEAVCAETYNDYNQLGRFTLRDQGTTIAIGKITKILS